MVKNKKHDTPKDDGAKATVHAAEQPAGQVVVGAPPEHWFIRHKKAIAIVVLVLGLVVLSVLAYRSTHKPVAKTATITHEQQIEATIREQTSQSLPSNATDEEKTTYYNNAIWLKVKDNTPDAQLADYYIQEVKPTQVKLGLDVQEYLINVLVSTGHSAEAKSLIAVVVASYQQSLATANPSAQTYLQTKIKTYTDLEKKL